MVIGKIKSLRETEEGKIHFVLDDCTGSIDIVPWSEEDLTDQTWKRFIPHYRGFFEPKIGYPHFFREGGYVKVIGILKKFNQKTSFMAFAIFSIKDFNEVKRTKTKQTNKQTKKQKIHQFAFRFPSISQTLSMYICNSKEALHKSLVLQSTKPQSPPKTPFNKPRSKHLGCHQSPSHPNKTFAMFHEPRSQIETLAPPRPNKECLCIL